MKFRITAVLLPIYFQLTFISRIILPQGNMPAENIYPVTQDPEGEASIDKRQDATVNTKAEGMGSNKDITIKFTGKN